MRYIGGVKARTRSGATRIIKRYENRKLYEAAARRYVTLEDLAQMIAEGGDLQVLDQKTGEDITTLVLAQVVLEGVKQRSASVPRQVLARLIRLGSGLPRRPEWSGPQEAAARARDEAERIVSELIRKGRLTLEDAVALRQEIAQSVHRLVAEAQRGLEDRLHGLLTRTEGEGIGSSLETLRERLMAFETYLSGPAPRPRRRAVRPRPKQ